MSLIVNQKSALYAELEKFSSVSLEDLSTVSLLNRVDTKYIGHISQLNDILSAIQSDYQVLEHMDTRSHEYCTTYMDTEDLKLYTQHHQGRSNRYKIRTRIYIDSDQIFNEIKFKDNKRKTYKKRIQRDNIIDGVDSEFLNFIEENTTLNGISAELKPALTVGYKRATFADKQFSERITLDYDLRFNNECRNNLLSDIFIIEIKKPRQHSLSGIESILRQKKFYPERISKYCIGIICTRENIKQNRFKPLLRHINMINYQGAF